MLPTDFQSLPPLVNQRKIDFNFRKVQTSHIRRCKRINYKSFPKTNLSNSINPRLSWFSCQDTCPINLVRTKRNWKFRDFEITQKIFTNLRRKNSESGVIPLAFDKRINYVVQKNSKVLQLRINTITAKIISFGEEAEVPVLFSKNIKKSIFHREFHQKSHNLVKTFKFFRIFINSKRQCTHIPILIFSPC